MLKRARLLFAVAVVLAVVILATSFPIGQLMQARSSAAVAATELSRVQRENRALASEVRRLKTGSAIQQIAHEDYGLVDPGQRSYVVMPRNGSSRAGAAAGPLGNHQIPQSDLVPSDSVLSPPAPSRNPGAGRSFWQRLVNRLEFWKAVV